MTTTTRAHTHTHTHTHVQLSQQIMELQEATTIHSGLQSGGLTRQSFQTEIKTIFKTWK